MIFDFVIPLVDAAIPLEFLPIAPAELAPRYATVARRIHKNFARSEIGHPNVVAIGTQAPPVPAWQVCVIRLCASQLENAPILFESWVWLRRAGPQGPSISRDYFLRDSADSAAMNEHRN